MAAAPEVLVPGWPLAFLILSRGCRARGRTLSQFVSELLLDSHDAWAHGKFFSLVLLWD